MYVREESRLLKRVNFDSVKFPLDFERQFRPRRRGNIFGLRCDSRSWGCVAFGSSPNVREFDLKLSLKIRRCPARRVSHPELIVSSCAMNNDRYISGSSV